jgi:plastocyanin
MKRREFVEKLGVGSAVLVTGGVLAGGPSAPVRAQQDDDEDHDHDHRPLSGDRANATVSFGEWQSDPPHDRFTVPNDRTRNQHQLIPHEARIKAGGSVNFVIGGFHNVNVYDDGTQPSEIDTTKIVPGSAPPLIDDPNHRVYRGLDPRTQSQDRVEVVHFPKAGRFLVICGVRGHFVNDNMFGFVRVDDDDDN